MAAPRLTFLWPFLFKPVSPALSQRSATCVKRGVQTTSRRRQEVISQRYGTANEPPPHLSSGSKSVLPVQNVTKTKALTKTSSKNGKAKKEKASKETPEQQAAIDVEKVETASAKQASEQASPQPEDIAANTLEATDSPPSYPTPPSPQLPATNPLEAVLNMPSSDETQTAQAPMYLTQSSSRGSSEEQRPPHISTPPYVHHFDTYSLVKRLEEGGWDQKQAVTTMKAMRLILADYMDLAREGLVSKSNVENETYLFRAACSELRTEINTKRKAEAERSRTERAQLQHEVDILGQRLTQDGGNLKDELKGMFDDRKMAVRNEQRSMESKIQELNYRITVALNSDSRSDVEGVRWIITKRAIAAIATCVLMVISSLKYASTMMQWQEEDRKRFAALAANNNNNNNGHGGNGSGGHGGNGANGGQGNEGGMRKEDLGAGELLVMEKGDNPAFVSLG